MAVVWVLGTYMGKRAGYGSWEALSRLKITRPPKVLFAL